MSVLLVLVDHLRVLRFEVHGDFLVVIRCQHRADVAAQKAKQVANQRGCTIGACSG